MNRTLGLLVAASAEEPTLKRESDKSRMTARMEYMLRILPCIRPSGKNEVQTPIPPRSFFFLPPLIQVLHTVSRENQRTQTVSLYLRHLFLHQSLSKCFRNQPAAQHGGGAGRFLRGHPGLRRSSRSASYCHAQFHAGAAWAHCRGMLVEAGSGR